MKKTINKRSILAEISQQNQAIETSIEQNDLPLIQVAYEVREALILNYFELFANAIDANDVEFFSEIKLFDSKNKAILKKIKIEVLEASTTQRKIRNGVKAYNMIFNKN
ncbi:MAG: hypothetical protein RPR40_12665 [Bermanella sp.]